MNEQQNQDIEPGAIAVGLTCAAMLLGLIVFMAG